jgi:hypothetical protein
MCFFLNSGGLWRDEVDLAHLSLLPSVSEVWQNLPHDSCPILMSLIVRAWSAAASLGNTDPGLRVRFVRWVVFAAGVLRWQLDDA